MDEKEPAGLGKCSRWKRGLFTALVGTAMILGSCQAVQPRTYNEGRESVRTSSEYKEFSMEKIKEEGIDSNYFDLETLGFMYWTFRDAEHCCLELKPEVFSKKDCNVIGLTELNEIVEKDAPYISEELEPLMNGNAINFPEVKPAYHDFGGKMILKNPTGLYSPKDNLVEMKVLELESLQDASSLNAHEDFHAQVKVEGTKYSIEKDSNSSLLGKLFGTGQQQKFNNEGLATLFQNEVCADMALDSDYPMKYYLNDVMASNILNIARENAMKTGNLDEFDRNFDKDIEMGFEDMNVWTEYHRPATLAYLKSIQEGRPIVVDGILIDGLYNFWKDSKQLSENFWGGARKMNDDELEGKLFVKKEGLLTPVYDGFTHDYLNGNKFVPLSVPSEVAYEKHWLFENEKKD